MAPMDRMTRSCISSKDRAQEVLRRRQEAESERERQREERLREIRERSARAAERKMQGMTQKQSKARTEAERLREIHTRRQEQEKREREQRLKTLLEKKAVSNRPAAALPPRVAFGSTVPRQTVLSKDPSAMARSTSATRTAAPRTAMTASVHPQLNTSRDRSRVGSNGSPRQATNSARRESTPRMPGAAIRSPQRTPVRPPSNTPNRMSQSVHPALCPTPPIQRAGRSQAARPAFPKSTPAVKKAEPKGRPPTATPTTHKPSVKTLNGQPAPKATVAIPPVQPVILAKIPQQAEVVVPAPLEEPPAVVEQKNDEVVEEQPIVDVREEQPAKEPETPVDPAPVVEVKTEVSKSEEIISIDADEPIQLPPVDPEAAHETDEGDSGNASEGAHPSILDLEPYHTRTVSDSSQKTRTISPVSEPEEVHSEGVEPLVTSIVDKIVANVTSPAASGPQPADESLYFDVSPASTPPKAEKGTPHDSSTPVQDVTGASTYFSANETPDRSTDEKSTTLEANSTANTTVSLGNGVVLGLAEKMQQERGSRQAKLQSLLANFGQNGGASVGPKVDPDSLAASQRVKEMLAKRLNQTNGDEERSFTPPTISSATPPLSTSGEQRGITLAEEFASLSMNGNRHSFHLPGQMPDHPVNS